MMAATLEDDDRSAVVVTRRRTKIVATLGPVSRHEGVLERLLEAGMDVARINLSHGSTAEHAESIATVRRAGPRRGAGGPHRPPRSQAPLGRLASADRGQSGRSPRAGRTASRPARGLRPL